MESNVDISKMSSEEYAKYLEGNLDNGGQSNTEDVETGSYNNTITEVFSKQYGDIGDDFFKNEKGEKLSEEDAIAKMFSSLEQKVTKSISSEDPFINDYLKAKSTDGFDLGSFLEGKVGQKNIMDMSSEEYVRERLTRDKYDSDDIDAFISKKSKIELDDWAKAKKQEDINRIGSINSERIEKAVIETKNKNKEFNLIVENNITKHFEGLAKNKFPIKFTDDVLNEIKNDAISLLSLNVMKENGVYENRQEINDVLKDDAILLQVLPFISLAKRGKLDSFLRNYFEDIKGAEFNKIESQPGIGEGGGKAQGTNWNRFKS